MLKAIPICYVYTDIKNVISIMGADTVISGIYQNYSMWNSKKKKQKKKNKKHS